MRRMNATARLDVELRERYEDAFGGIENGMFLAFVVLRGS